jgi:hypothetical protein
MYEHNTQHDLEDLPTTWGGYDKLPVRAKLFHNTGKPLVAMSGKFHTSWGEFGGFKHPDAIRYEAAAMIAYGTACNFGDQLHPLGEMDLDTYRNVGIAYEYVEQIEAYGPGDFAVVDPEADLSAYETIVLTGAAGLSASHAAKLNAYVAAGGGLLVLGESALDEVKSRFLLDVGATYVGPGEYDVDYTVVGDTLGQGMVSSPFLNYEPALRVRPDEGTQVLAAIREPYFSRT